MKVLFVSKIYHGDVRAHHYEVIVVDNGSNPPLQPKAMAGRAGNFRLVRIDEASPSPASVVNRGLAEARGDVVGVMIDGARIVTPGRLHFARHGVSLYDKAVVATLGWYRGYDLESIDWPSEYFNLRWGEIPYSAGSYQRPALQLCVGKLNERTYRHLFFPARPACALFRRGENR